MSLIENDKSKPMFPKILDSFISDIGRPILFCGQIILGKIIKPTIHNRNDDLEQTWINNFKKVESLLN